MNIVAGENIEVRPAEPDPTSRRARTRVRKRRERKRRITPGRLLSIALMIALASGPAAVQAFREGVGAPEDLLACDATIGALSAEGSALDVMLTKWGEAADDAIARELPRARQAMSTEDVDGFVDAINAVIDRCHDVSHDFTEHFDAYCEATPGACQDRFRLL